MMMIMCGKNLDNLQMIFILSFFRYDIYYLFALSIAAQSMVSDFFTNLRFTFDSHSCKYLSAFVTL
jgi:hypothetical protein